MLTRKKAAAAGVTVALAGALVVGGLTGPFAPAFAAPGEAGTIGSILRQTPPNTPPNPAPKPGSGRGPGQQLTPEQQQRQQQHQQAQQEFHNRVAANLGISPQALQEAFKKARIDGVNQAVAQGKLSQDQANQIIQRINSGQAFGPGGHPGLRQGPGGQGGPAGRAAMHGGMQAAAQALGLTPEQLRQEVQGGKSLAQLAQARNISRDALKTKLQASQQQQLDQAVQQGRMTREQATQVMSRFAANLDRMLDFTPGQRLGPGGAGRP